MNETRNLPVMLIEDEVHARALQLAEVLEELDQAEDRKAAANDAFKAEIKGHKLRASELGEQVRTRREYREVEVSVLPNWEQRVMETVRRDTGELIASRPMTSDELQAPLPSGTN